MLRQTTSLEITSVRHRNDIKNLREELIDILSILKVESTWIYARRIDVIFSKWIRLS